MKYILILIAFLLGQVAMAQETSMCYKVERYAYNIPSGLKLKIRCEMADIEIKKSNTSEITVVCTYSAKHKDKAIASSNLDRHNIRVKRTLNEVFISNFFTLQSNEKEPEAKLNIKFEINVPAGVTVDLENRFGSLLMDGVKIRGIVNQQFGKVILKNFISDLEIIAKISDIEVNSGAGKLTIENTSGDISVLKFNGEQLTIKHKSASLLLNQIGTNTNVSLSLFHSNLQCKNMNLDQRSLSFSSYREPIKSNLNVQVVEKQNYYYLELKRNAALFSIKAEFSKINLY